MQNPRAKPQCKGCPGLWGAPCCTLPSFSAACPKPLVPNPSMTPCAKFSCTHVTPDSRANPRAKKPSCKRSAGIHTAADASSAEGQGHNSACSPPRAKEKPHKNLVQKKPSCKRAPRAQELTRGGEAVLVFGDVGVDALQHHPHGEREQAGQEAVEEQVEEQDQPWGKGGDPKTSP